MRCKRAALRSSPKIALHTEKRMSLLEKLQNTISYKINNLVSDPAAATYAAEQKQKEEQEKANADSVKKIQDVKVAQAQKAKEAELNKPPTITKNTINTAIKTFVIILGTLGALVLGSMAANASVHRHIAIRILYFIYGSGIGTIIAFFSVTIPLLLLLFIPIIGFLYLSDNLPHMYAFIPITSMKPESWIGSLFLWPFRWDAPDHADHYEAKMETYKDLLASGLAVATGAPLLEKEAGKE
jgi:hypothetical protein